MLRRQRKPVALLLLASLGSLVSLPTLIQPLRAQTPSPDPRFGVVEAFWDTSAAIEAGVTWERILFQWSQLQPNGPDDWNTMHVPDEWLQWAQAQGREVIGLLKNTPYWATDADPPIEASPPRGLDLPVDDPNNAWAAFVRRVATFFGERGVHRWIIWNEPDISPGVYGQEWAGSIEEYYRLLKVAYLVIKEVDPEAHVHLAGLTFWHDRDWLRRFLAVATADPAGPAQGYFFDVVSLHIYFQTDTVDFIVNEAHAALAAHGLNKPIWINETNAPPDSDPQWPLERPRWRLDLAEQASFIMQAYALGLAAGADRIGVYKLIDVGLPPGGEPFGLLRPDHSRRPAYTAYGLVTHYYASTRSARIFRQPLWTQVTLDRGEWTTRVFWARTNVEVSMTVPALSTQANLVDQEGKVQTLDGNSGSYSLTLPGARCADEILGCIIGGPTYLLIEESPVGDMDAFVAYAATATTEAGEVEEKPPVEDSDAPSVIATVRPTLPSITLPASATPDLQPTLSPSPSGTPTPTASPTAPPSKTPTLTVTQSATPNARPTLSPASPPTTARPPVKPADGSRSIEMFGLVALILLVGLVGFTLWWARRNHGRQFE